MKSFFMFAFFLAAIAMIAISASSFISATPLDDYVAKADPSFKYFYTGHSFKSIDYTCYIYNLTSQTWQSDDYSNHPVWTHHVAVIVPNELTYPDKAFMYITGGDNNHPTSYPDATDEDIFVTASVAVNAGVVGATLFQVPNQPITFKNDPWHKGGRSEDAAIAITWYDFIQDPSNPYVVLELPMTKSATQALTMLQEVIPKHTTAGKAVTGFCVGGASKRGWTTWLATAVDKRIVAQIPIVLDAVHVHKFLHRQFQFYGGWTFALTDYWHCNITRLADTPNFAKLMNFIDPYFYFDRYRTVPTMLVNAVGDEFQMPDDWRFFQNASSWKQGIKTGIMVKDAEHSLATGVPEVLTSVSAFAEGFLGNKKTIPLFTWNISEDGTISVTTSEKPVKIDISVADSPGGVSEGRRDFRWAAINATPCIVKVFGACVRPVLWWTSKPLSKYIAKYSDTEYSALVPRAEGGKWRAFMIELRFSNNEGKGTEYYFTSGVSVIPNSYPFPPCQGEGCYGHLL